MTKRILSIALVCALLLTVVLSFSASAFPADGKVRVPVILYHNILAPGESTAGLDPMLNTPAELFASHMRTLKAAGYETITYEQYYNYATQGLPLPERPIIISLDDGYVSNYNYAYPVLKELDMKATIFIIADRRGKALSRNPHFSWNQAREMADSGLIEIGSHTYSHQVLTSLDAFHLEFELRTSKNMIERYLGRKCSVMSYPEGAYDERVMAAAEAAGYKIANKVGDVGVNRPEEGLYAMKRLTVSGNWTGQRLLQMIDSNMEL